ncbi:hypothetical protein ACF0H5_020169 [Mactra antiquata]
MEVDPPTSNNIALQHHGTSASSGFASRDLESTMNNGGNNGIPTPGILKRCNSAPMINILVSTAGMQISPPSSFSTTDSQRTRRFSSSSMHLHGSSTPVKVADRLNQLKQEESHIADRDIQREREVRSAIQISTSWTERFYLGDHEPMSLENAVRRPRSFSESLHIFTSPSMIGCALSPTRVGKQCFSPSMQVPIKNHTFTPSPSPSPTRKSIPRSISPVIRPSPLGKRKLEPDGDNRFESCMSPPKKFHTGPTTPDRLIPHPLAHSISSSSCEGSSPEQIVPREANIHPNIPISHRPQPHMFGFMPLKDSHEMQTTDSETSDVAESTDMSETGDTSSSMLLSGDPHLTFTPVRTNNL